MATALHPRFVGANGDPRQLYALDIDAIGDKLFFLDEGDADFVRPRVNAGRLICPFPGCPDPHYRVRGGLRRRHHFAHRPGAQRHSPESWYHFAAKHVVANWALNGGAGAPRRVQVDDEVVPNRQRPDVLIELADGGRVAVEIQYSALSPTDWLRRHRGYQSLGIHDLWLFGHTGRQLSVIRQSTESADLLARLSDLHQFMLTNGVLPLWINPDERTIGVPWVSPQPKAKALRTPSVPAWFACPTSADRQANLAADSLADVFWAAGQIVSPSHDAIEASLQRRFGTLLRLEVARRTRRDAAVRAQAHAKAQAKAKQIERRSAAWVPRLRSSTFEERTDAICASLGFERRPPLVDAPLPADDRVYINPSYWHALLLQAALESPDRFSHSDAVELLRRLSPASSSHGLRTAATEWIMCARRSGLLR